MNQSSDSAPQPQSQPSFSPSGYGPPTSDSIDALTTQVSKILQTLRSRLALPSSSTATLANSIDIACATLKPPSWILDSGTSSHMFVN